MQTNGLRILVLAAAALFSTTDCACGTSTDTPIAPVADSAIPQLGVDNPDPELNDPVMQQMGEIFRAFQTVLFNSLAASPEPRDWAIGSLMTSFDSESGILRTTLLQRAVDSAPNDVIVQWIALLQSTRDANTKFDASPLSALQRLEPHNAAVWAYTLVEATQHQDQRAIEDALERMADSTTDNEHFSDLIKAQLDVFKRYPLPDEYFAVAAKEFPSISKSSAPYMYVMAITSAVALPAYQSLIKACTVNSLTGENAPRAGNCAAIGRLMAGQGGTIIANRIGFSVLRVSGTFNREDVQLARNQDWVWQEKGGLHAHNGGEPPIAELIADMADWCKTGSELESARQSVARAGKSSIPPSDWIDSNSPFSEARLIQDRLAANRSAQPHSAQPN